MINSVARGSGKAFERPCLSEKDDLLLNLLVVFNSWNSFLLKINRDILRTFSLVLNSLWEIPGSVRDMTQEAELQGLKMCDIFSKNKETLENVQD